MSEEIDSPQLWNTIYHTLFSEGAVVQLFIERVDKTKLCSVIKNYFDIMPSNDANFTVRYLIDQILGRFDKINEERKELYGKELTLNYMSHSKDPVLKELIPYIKKEKSPINLSETEAHNLGFYILMLRNTYPGAFETFYNELDPIIKDIGPKRLSEYLGPAFFLLIRESPPKSFIDSYQIDVHAIKDLFISNFMMTNEETCGEIQKKVSNMFQFPNFMPPIKDNLLTCVNTVITQKTPYADILKQLFVEYISCNEYDQVIQNLGAFGRIIPYFLIAYRDKIYENTQAFYPLLSQKYPPSPAAGLVLRFKNDSKLLSLISFLSGQDELLTFKDLESKSIVSYLQFALGNPEILEYANLKYYIIDDKRAEMDFDFIKGYTVFRTFFSVFANQRTHAKKIIDDMYNSLISIKNAETREKIIVDLFSLIFMKNANNKFIFDVFLAKTLLKAIAPLTTNKYIQNANNLLQRTPFWQKDPPFITFFTRDPAEIFEAVLSKNWAKAEELTLSVSYYRKLYILARSIDEFVNNGGRDIPEESVDYIQQLKLEISLVTYPNEYIDSMKELHKDLEPIFAKRTSNPMDALNSKKWREIYKFIDSMDNAIDLSPFLEKIEECSTLHSFVDYLNEYRHVTNSNKFDFVFAVSEAFNKGNIEFAQKYASMVNKDLIEIIISNISKFHITNDFIIQNYEKYPIETIALALTEVDPTVIEKFEGISDTLKKYISPNTIQAAKKTNVQKLKQLMKIINDNNKDDYPLIDDIVYSIPANDIIDKLLALENYNQIAIEVLSIVSYAADEEQSEKIESIIDQYIISTEKGSPTDITNCIMKRSKSHALEYIKTLSYDEIENIIIDFIQNKMDSDPLFVSILISEFPDHFLTLLAKFGRNDKYMPLLLHGCPDNQKEVLSAFMSLPQAIFSKCESLDPDEVIRILLENRDFIFQLTEGQRSILTDERLIKLLKAFIKPVDVLNAATFLKKFFTDKNILNEYATDYVTKIIKLINVNSVETEDNAKVTLLYASRIWGIYEESEKIQVLKKIVDISPYLRYGLEYNFKEFGTPEFSKYLVSLCMEEDLSKVCLLVCSAYDISTDYMNAHITKMLLTFGFVEEAKQVKLSKEFRIEKNPIKGWTDNSYPFYDKTIAFVCPLLYNTPFSTLMLDRIKNAKLPNVTKNPRKYYKSNYEYIQQAYNVYIKLAKDIKGAQITNEPEQVKLYQKNALHAQHFISHFTDLPNALSILVSMGNFDQAYQILWMMDAESNRVAEEAFIHQLFLPAISVEEHSKIFDFFKAQDPNLELTAHFWDKLEAFMHKKGLVEGLLFVCDFRNKLEDMASNALTLFTTAKTLNEKYLLIGKAFAGLDNAKRCREGKMTLQPKFRESIMTNGELNELFELVSLQLQFCQFCFESNNITCTNDTDLIHNPESAALMAANILLDGKNDALYRAIVEVTNVTEEEVGLQAVHILCETDQMSSLKYLTDLKTKNPQLMSKLLTEVIKKFSLGNMFMYIPQFIILEDDPRKQAMLYLDFDFLSHAYELILEYKFDDLLPLVAYRASQTGNTMTLFNFIK